MRQSCSDPDLVTGLVTFFRPNASQKRRISRIWPKKGQSGNRDERLVRSDFAVDWILSVYARQRQVDYAFTFLTGCEDVLLQDFRILAFVFKSGWLGDRFYVFGGFGIAWIWINHVWWLQLSLIQQVVWQVPCKDINSPGFSLRYIDYYIMRSVAGWRDTLVY